MYDFQQYSGEKLCGDIYEVLVQKKICNCIDLFDLASILTEDYNLRRVNIIPLIKEGMNARLLMYVRLCYMIRGVDDDYYKTVRTLESVDAIVKYRKQWYHKRNLQFSNYDYENWWLLYLSLNEKQRVHIQFDFEMLYEDCDYNHHISTENENKAGFVYFRNGHNAVSDYLFEGCVKRLDREDTEFQTLMQKKARFFDMPKVPNDLFRNDG